MSVTLKMSSHPLFDFLGVPIVAMVSSKDHYTEIYGVFFTKEAFRGHLCEMDRKGIIDVFEMGLELYREFGARLPDDLAAIAEIVKRAEVPTELPESVAFDTEIDSDPFEGGDLISGCFFLPNGVRFDFPDFANALCHLTYYYMNKGGAPVETAVALLQQVLTSNLPLLDESGNW